MTDNTTNNALWVPNPERKQNSNLQQFVKYINREFNLTHSIDDYPALHQWTVDHRDLFWKACWDFFGVIHQQKYQQVLKNGEQIKDPLWFDGATLNFAQNLLELSLKEQHEVALIEYNESGKPTSYTYEELSDKVKRFSLALKSLGVRKGDRVAACLPNCPESVIAMLACSAIGAVWSSCSPDFGTKGMQDRFEQIEPVLLLACQDYRYNGKVFDTTEKIQALVKELKSLKAVVWIESKFRTEKPDPNSDDKNLPQVFFHQSIESVDSTDGFEYEYLPFNHPLYVMFSSGTTGVPKCIVHGSGGTLIQHLKEHQLHCDLKSGDVLFYFTTCGWMMWNWLVSGLASKATLILYDGSPFYPDENRIFDIADQEGITHLGLGAKFISSIEKNALEPIQSHSLVKLRSILSTGSPLSHESFEYVYKSVKEDINLASISGGTDIISCFVLGNPVLPVFKGEIQCKGLGMDVDVFDDRGQSIKQKKGELVCKQSFPSMPIGFWNDEKGEKFHKAYFSQFENCWAHGDYAEITEHEGFIIHGRSDAVLNPGGVRIGTAEIYRQVEKVDEVLESIVVGQNWEDDLRVILFVVLREGLALNEEIISKIKSCIRTNTTPRHVPALILQVPDIPRTKSGKIVELAVRNVVNGDEVRNTDALANPEALAHFRI